MGMSEREPVRLKGRQYEEQLNISVPRELKALYRELKSVHKIDTAEECRRAVAECLLRLKHTT